jgi:uncharacterized protein (DUF1810 family)
MVGPEDRLARFVEAQQGIYRQALAELRAGRKRSHWMWFVFPQLKGLGLSSRSLFYGLESVAEARLYLDHVLLGPRLRECTIALLGHQDESAEAMLGDIDATKLRSSMTLFESAGGESEPFGQCLAAFFGGERDPATLRLLDAAGQLPVS